MGFTVSYLVPRPRDPQSRGDRVPVRKTTYVYYRNFPKSSLEKPEAVYHGDCVGWTGKENTQTFWRLLGSGSEPPKPSSFIN